MKRSAGRVLRGLALAGLAGLISGQSCLDSGAGFLQSDSPVGAENSGFKRPPIDDNNHYAYDVHAKIAYESSGPRLEGAPDGRHVVYKRFGYLVASTQQESFSSVKLGGIRAEGGFIVGIAPADVPTYSKTVNIAWTTYTVDEDRFYTADFDDSVSTTGVSLPIKGGPVYSQMVYIELEPKGDKTDTVEVDYLWFE